jgi:hypothetical protein
MSVKQEQHRTSLVALELEELHLIGSVAEHFAGKNMRKGIGKLSGSPSLKLFHYIDQFTDSHLLAFLKIHCVLFRRDIDANHFATEAFAHSCVLSHRDRCKVEHDAILVTEPVQRSEEDASWFPCYFMTVSVGFM